MPVMRSLLWLPVIVSVPWPPKIRNEPSSSAEPSNVNVSLGRSGAASTVILTPGGDVAVVHGEVVIVAGAERSEPGVLGGDQADALDAGELGGPEDDRIAAAKAELVDARGAAVDMVGRTELEVLAEVEGVVASSRRGKCRCRRPP